MKKENPCWRKKLIAIGLTLALAISEFAGISALATAAESTEITFEDATSHDDSCNSDEISFAVDPRDVRTHDHERKGLVDDPLFEDDALKDGDCNGAMPEYDLISEHETVLAPSDSDGTISFDDDIEYLEDEVVLDEPEPESNMDLYMSDTYNIDAAVCFARSNYTNNSCGLCAEFVSRCLRAGGLSISIQKRAVNLRSELLKSNCFQEAILTYNYPYVYSNGNNAGKVSVGDVIIYKSASTWEHAVLVTGINPKKQVLATSRNASYVDNVYTGSYYTGSYSCKSNTIEIHIFHYTGGVSTSGSATFGIPKASEISTNSAKVEITYDQSGTLRSGGIKWGTSTSLSNSPITFSLDNANGKMFSYLKQLNANTTYYYQFFVVDGNQKSTYSSISSFTTLANESSEITIDITPCTGSFSDQVYTTLANGTGFNVTPKCNQTSKLHKLGYYYKYDNETKWNTYMYYNMDEYSISNYTTNKGYELCVYSKDSMNGKTNVSDLEDHIYSVIFFAKAVNGKEYKSQQYNFIPMKLNWNVTYETDNKGFDIYIKGPSEISTKTKDFRLDLIIKADTVSKSYSSAQADGYIKLDIKSDAYHTRINKKDFGNKTGPYTGFINGIIPANYTGISSVLYTELPGLSLPNDSYTVSFNSNGGTAFNSQKISYGEKAVAPNDPSKMGYIFDGWYTDDTYVEEWNFNRAVTDNITLYAKWNSINVVGVSLDKASASLLVGDSINLVASISPQNATNKGVSWFSNNTDVATVNSNGVVTAKAAGTATITVKTSDSGKTATCKVTVTQPVTDVSLNKTSTMLTVGQTETLTATINPNNATNKTVTWSSSDTNVASVDNNGVVTAKAEGTAIITVRTEDGGKTASCEVSVTASSNQTMICEGICGDNISWILYDDGELVLSGSGEMYNFEAVGTGRPWQSYYNSIKSVLIGNGITYIGSDSFSYCNILTDISIPNSLTGIGRAAFAYTGLQKVVLPENLTSIGNQAFLGCENMSQIVLPSSLLSIGDYAFSGCKSLSSVTIPEQVNSLGTSLFGGCDALRTLEVSRDNRKYDSRNNCNAIISTSDNCLIIGCNNTVIPSGVTRIGKNAFESCDGLENIVIGEDVEEIGYFSFGQCNKLKTVTIPKSLTKVDSYAFRWCSVLSDVYYQGTQSQWKSINISDEGNESLTSAKMHFKSVDQWTVSFSNGSQLYHQENVNDGESIILPIPVQSGYTFSGWFTKPDGKGIRYTDSTLITENVTLYAFWKKDETGDSEDISADLPAGEEAPLGIWLAGIEDLTYDGTKQSQDFRVYDNTKLLIEKTDYTVAYKNNQEAYSVSNPANPSTSDKKYAPQVILTMKGNYSGKEIAYFSIEPLSIDDDTAFSAYMKGSGTGAKPVLLWNGKTLKQGTDYTVSSEGDVITLDGTGNFTGTRTLDVNWDTTAPVQVSMSKVKVSPIPAQVFKGSAYEIEELMTAGGEYPFEFKVSNGTEPLNEGIDYRVVRILNGTRAGKATVVLQGLNAGGTQGASTNSFVGERRVTFRIAGYPMTGSDISVTDENGGGSLTAPYQKAGAKPAIKVWFGDTVLKEGRDYTLKYTGNTKYPSTSAGVVIQGKGNFAGKKTVPFSVTQRPFTDASGITVVAGDKAVGKKANQYQTSVKVFDAEGKLLKAGTDYEKAITYLQGGQPLSAESFPQAGEKVTVRVTGKGGYSDDTIDAEYTILPAGAVTDIGKATIQIKDQQYDKGRAIEITSSDQIKLAYIGKNKTPLTLSADGGATGDFIVVPGSYVKNTSKGTASVTLMGINGYSGAKTVKFKIGARSIIGNWFGWLF